MPVPDELLPGSSKEVRVEVVTQGIQPGEHPLSVEAHFNCVPLAQPVVGSWVATISPD